MTRAERFEGRIGRTVAESEPWFDERPHPGGSAPNVVVILLDDTGFAQLGCFGSTIDTPNIDALAASGLQFTNFHVTPLCSPTRAALLTGRSHHMAGMRSLANFRTGVPNMLGHVSSHTATMAEVLRDTGYTTFAIGKWHLAPMEECSAAGPFDQWPLGRGFDRFYGFMEGETDQFHPELVCDNHLIEPPATVADGYHLSADLVDQTLRMVADAKGVRPDRPFFAYLAFGATHAPHQAPPEYLAKYRGAFDEGWDVVRQRWFDRQIELGVIPPGTTLAPHNPGVQPWVELSDDERALAARLQEAFAAFLDHTDTQIGRLVDGLRRLGQLDDTVLVFLSDNGASQEGGPFGVLHEMKFFNGIMETPSSAVEHLDEIGGPHSHTNYPWGWAQTGNCPFRWYKQNTHEGGVHVPMIMHWPAGIAPHQRGTKRNQFVYVSDIAPTVYELARVVPPTVFRGVAQHPVTGHAFTHVLADASAPSANTLQYFEMAGSRALVAGEWKAVCRHEREADYDTEPWELYHLTTDPSECDDRAAAEPELLGQLVALWWEEAERNGVLPLDERMFELFGARFRDHSPHRADRRYVYRPPMSPMPGQASAAIAGRSFDLAATIDRSAGDEGVLFATGTENSGIALFIQDDRLVLDYNAFDDHIVIESATAVPVGPSAVELRIRRTGASTGTAALFIDGTPSGDAELPLFMRMISSIGPSIGYDHGSAVSRHYTAPFHFTGTLESVEIQVSPERQSDVTDVAARAEMSRQ